MGDGSALVAGAGDPPAADRRLGICVLAPFSHRRAQHQAGPARSGLHHPAYRPARPRLRLGSDAAGQGDPPAPASGRRARLGFLGILRIRAGHSEPFRGRPRRRLPLARGLHSAGCISVLSPYSRSSSRYPSSVSRSGASCIRPAWLGKVSPESGFIALLIFLLMITYLAALFVPEARPSSHALWWAHTLTLLRFLPLIPHTKHLHLVLSPVTVFLKRDRFSKIPPLVGDEDFGLDTGKDVTQLRRAAGLFVRRMRALHASTAPRINTGKILEPERNRAGRARLPERIRRRRAKSRCSANICRRKPCSSAPPAAPANFNARWASSICRSSSACGAAP